MGAPSCTPIRLDHPFKKPQGPHTPAAPRAPSSAVFGPAVDIVLRGFVDHTERWRTRAVELALELGPLRIWLVVWTPLKNMSQLGWLFPTYGKIKNVPNHQPGMVIFQRCSKGLITFLNTTYVPTKTDIFQQGSPIQFIMQWLPCNLHPIPSSKGHSFRQNRNAFPTGFLSVARKSAGNWNWLVVGPPLWKIWKSIGMMRFPTYGKIKNGNQTTNQERKVEEWLFQRVPRGGHPSLHRLSADTEEARSSLKKLLGKTGILGRCASSRSGSLIYQSVYLCIYLYLSPSLSLSLPLSPSLSLSLPRIFQLYYSCGNNSNLNLFPRRWRSLDNFSSCCIHVLPFCNVVHLFPFEFL